MSEQEKGSPRGSQIIDVKKIKAARYLDEMNKRANDRPTSINP